MKMSRRRVKKQDFSASYLLNYGVLILKNELREEIYYENS